jgi:hypothetical protein
MSAVGVVAAFMAGCAFTANCTLLMILWRDERRARHVSDRVEPVGPTPLADEVEGWLRDLR